MTKVNTSKKSWIFSSLLMAGLLFSNTQAMAQSAKDMLCNSSPTNTSQMEEMPFDQMNPFVEIDFAATINKLPAKQKAEAQALMNKIEKEESDFEATANDEERLYDLVCNANTEIVSVNLLDKLSSAERTKAEKLWQDIKNNEADQEQKFEELYAILDRVAKTH